MKAREKTKEQLLKELTSLRRKLTNARKAIQELRKSEEWTKAFIDSASEAFIILDENLNIVDLNQTALDYLPAGTPRSKVIGKSILNFVPYLKDTPRYERYREIIRSGGVFHEDGVALTLGPKQRYLSVRAFPVDKGLGIITTDITERKLAEENLRESEETFWNLAEQSPNMIFINIGGQVIYANARASAVMGYTREEFYAPDFDFLTLIEPDSVDRVKEAFARHMRGEDIPPYEYSLRTRDGRRIEAIIATKLIPYHGKTAILGIVTDVTLQKRAEQMEQKARQGWESIFQAIGHPIIILDPVHGLLEANRATLRLTGQTLENLRGKKCYQIFHDPDSTEPAPGCPMEKMLLSGILETVEMEMEAFGGTYLVSCAPVLDAHGQIEKIIHIATDITERKRAQEALRRSEEKYHRLTDIAEEGIAIHDRGMIVEANEALGRMFGYTVTEMIGTHAAKYATPETWNLILKNIAAGYTEPYEGQGVRKDGSTFWVELRGKPIVYEGRPMRVGVFRDITARKEAAERIHRLNSVLKAIRNVNQLLVTEKDVGRLIEKACTLLIESLHYKEAWIFLLDEEGAPVAVAEAGSGGRFQEFVRSGRGTPPCVAAARRQPGLLPLSSRDEPCRSCSLIREGELFEGGCVGIKYEGHVYGVLGIHLSSKVPMDEEERALILELAGDLALGLHNIRLEAERQAAEQALQRSEEQFRMLTEQSLMGVFLIQNGRFRYVNEATSQISGYTVEEIMNWGANEFAKVIHPDDRPLVMEQARRKQAGEKDVLTQYEWRMITRSGETKWVESWSKTIMLENGPADFATMIDITKRKAAEAALRESEEKYRLIAENTSDFIGITDTQGTYLYASPSHARYLGYDVESMIGRPGGFIIHPDDDERVARALAPFYDRKRIQEWLERDESVPPITVEYRVRDNHGDWHHIETIVHLITDPHGEEHRVIHIGRDITQRIRDQQALREGAERFRALIEHSADGIAVIAPDGTVSYTAPSNDRILGYLPGENPGANMFDFIHPEDHLKLQDTFLQILASPDQVITSDFRARHRDGSWHVIETTGRNMIHAPSVGGIVVNFRDITERRRAEEALAQSEERWRSLVQNAPNLIVNINREGIIQFVNHAIPPFKPEEIIGRSIYEFILPRSREIAERAIRATFETGEPSRYEAEGTGPHGTVSWYETHLGPLRRDGHVVGLTLVSTDITERRRAEETLRQKENELRTIFENANDAIILLDEAGIVLECNQRLKDIFGYEPAEVIGRNFNEVPFADPETSQWVIAEYAKMIATQRTVLLSFEARRKDGSRVLVEAGASRLHPPTGPGGTLALIRDITERRRAEEREHEMERLRELDRMRTELLANVSHELRTPLTTIKGYASMIAEYPESLSPEEKRLYLQAIEKSADGLNELVESLLDMSRLEAGLLQMEPRPADIGAVLRQTVEEARVRSPEHTFVVSAPSDLPAARFDPKRIRQVLDNILDNAVKYSHKGTTITAQASMSDSGLQVSVSDQGVGIPTPELERIFDRMYRVRRDQTARVSGMGLGLSIAKGIIEAHRGRIWMESTEGKGSTCFFTLPLEAEETGHDKSKNDPHR